MRLSASRLAIAALALIASATASAASDDVYFSAVTDVSAKLVQKINAETVRIDMSCWYLTDDNIATALLNRFNAGVPVRLIGDRGSIFEIDALTRAQFYRLANAGVPIRLRYNPTWYPEIDHWKVTIFAGQNLVATGSGNYTPFELTPFSSTNYKDEVTLFTTDPALVGAFRTKFDQLWNDTLPEPESLVPNPPYFKNWDDACATESACDYRTQYPNPKPMVIDTRRLEPDNPMPPEMVWGQGPDFNNRLVSEINAEPTAIDFIIYRLTVDNITQALLDKFHAGVPIRLIIEPNEYLNRNWPEFWLTHANLDKLWAAGVPIKQRLHDGLTHMKVLITSTASMIASSNYAAAWQRDADYFVPRSTKPDIWQAEKDRFQTMWTDTQGFTDFTPLPPDGSNLVSPANNAAGVSATGALVWSNATFATNYDVYLGTSSNNMTLVGNVPADLSNNPPSTYSWTPTTPLQPGTRYDWRIIARTNATPVNPSLVGPSTIFVFTTAGAAGPPAAPSSPSPSDAATGVSITPTLGWTSGAVGTTYDVAFGTANPPATVATGLTTASYQPGSLAPTTTYFWRITSVSSGGSTPGAVWSFTTGSGGTGTLSDIVIYASDVTARAGAWTTANDATAAGGVKLTNPDAGRAALANPLAAPVNYFETTFQAQGSTRYRVWLRIHPIADSKFNDSVFVQFSDSVDASNNPTYRIGTTGGYTVNLWTCADCQTTGWGWQRNAYWLGDTGDVWFQNAGSHTIRVQTREDGAEIDQIVISPITYSQNAPGAGTNDATIVPKPSGPQPPASPSSPSPASGASGVSPSATLTWTAANATTYDIRFGATNPPPQVATGVSTASYAPPDMLTSTAYFWQIVAHNAAGATAGPIWSFQTASAPPAVPNTPSPADAATGVNPGTSLTWVAAGATSYDVLFGTSDPPSQIATGVASAAYTPPALATSTKYFWQIVAHNASGASQGPEWTFTTAASAPAPSVPASPSPSNSATGVSTTPTLTWTSGGATSYDVYFGTTASPPLAASNLTAASFTPPPLDSSTQYFWKVVARSSAGVTAGPVWQFTAAAPGASGDIVIYGSDVAPSAMHGEWSAVSDPTAAGGVAVASADTGVSQTTAPLASPAHYFDATFTANAGVQYAIWLRLRALNNSKFNDSVYVQFSDARANGSAVYPLGSNSGLTVNLATDSAAGSLNGWGWQNGAYWLTQATTVSFAASGSHTLRVQVREDGVAIDQIVLSSSTFLNAAPGGVSNDSTIVPKPSHQPAGPPTPPSAPASPAPSSGASGVATSTTLTWTATGATNYDVAFGTSPSPPIVTTAQAAASYAPGALSYSTTYYWQITAHNTAGTTAGPVWSFTSAPPAPTNIVIDASDVPASAMHGSWTTAPDATSPNGVKLATPDNGVSNTNNPLASPADYFDVTFNANAGTPYNLWLRLQALGNNKLNDAVWVQFSDGSANGSPVYPLNTTSGLLVNLATDASASSLNGWGWQNSAYWLSQPTTITFASSGPHTLRIQVREDGVQLDQIVLSPGAYLSSAPGSVTNDATIVSKP